MISDYLAAQSIEVRHVIDAAPPEAHALRAEARLADGALIYDGHTQPTLGIDCADHCSTHLPFWTRKMESSPRCRSPFASNSMSAVTPA